MKIQKYLKILNISPSIKVSPTEKRKRLEQNEV